jgi:hypothetical protein
LIDAFRPRSDFLRVMQERGLIHQCSDPQGLDDKARSGSLAGATRTEARLARLDEPSQRSRIAIHVDERGARPSAAQRARRFACYGERGPVAPSQVVDVGNPSVLGRRGRLSIALEPPDLRPFGGCASVTPAGAHPFDARCESWSSEVSDMMN